MDSQLNMPCQKCLGACTGVHVKTLYCFEVRFVEQDLDVLVGMIYL